MADEAFFLFFLSFFLFFHSPSPPFSLARPLERVDCWPGLENGITTVCFAAVDVNTVLLLLRVGIFVTCVK